MTTPTIYSSDKHFPNVLLERIIAKTEETFTNTHIAEFEGITQEQLRASIQNAGNFMVIGAKLALDYINEIRHNDEYTYN